MMPVTVSTASFVHIGRTRSVCQDVADALAVQTPTGVVHVAAVCDGHGDDGLVIADKCLSGLTHELGTLPWIGDAGAAISSAFERVQESLQETDGATSSGATAAVAVLTPDGYLHVGHVGDSRAVVFEFRRDGDEIDHRTLTEDHTPHLEREYRRLLKTGEDNGHTGTVLHVNGCLRVLGVLAPSRAFGDTAMAPYVIAAPDVRSEPMPRVGSLVVLASDGLWGAMRPEDVAGMFRNILHRVFEKEPGVTMKAALRIAVRVVVRHVATVVGSDDVAIAAIAIGGPADFGVAQAASPTNRV